MTRTDYRRTRSFERRGQNYSPAREAWVTVGPVASSFVLYDYSHDPNAEDSDGRTIGIRLPGMTTPSYLMLDALTVAELDALRAFFDHAIAAARPICERLDADAATSVTDQANLPARLFRPAPELHVRDRDRTGGDHGSDQATKA